MGPDGKLQDTFSHRQISLQLNGCDGHHRKFFVANHLSKNTLQFPQLSKLTINNEQITTNQPITHYYGFNANFIRIKSFQCRTGPFCGPGFTLLGL